jgi:hypothetical protein
MSFLVGHFGPSKHMLVSAIEENDTHG